MGKSGGNESCIKAVGRRINYDPSQSDMGRRTKLSNKQLDKHQ